MKQQLFTLFALLILLPCYAAADDKVLKIDPRQMEALQDMSSEITSMLEDLGYEQRHIRNPETGQPAYLIQQDGQYKMLFRATAHNSVKIIALIMISDNVTSLYFSEDGGGQLGDIALDYYHKLSERAALEFGADNVSGKRSFFPL
jgi:hypothetical protein